ncbi:glycoside hydrolase family 76 protein [Sphingobacterium siyangense]|uniref:glycoside hydrolase family 76 protein n=1 Tax=Sphingobacterium siyangense TaxID=459529 RepID=UPI002FDD8818
MGRVYVTLLITALIGLSCCKRDDKIDHQTEIVFQKLVYPTNDTTVTLADNNADPIEFYWDRATTKDKTTVFYKIVFDDEKGDFSTPLLELVPDKLGTQNNFSLGRDQLDILAKKAGVSKGMPIKIKWTIKAANGIASSILNAYNIFELHAEDQDEVSSIFKNADELMTSLTTLYLDGKPRDIWTNTYPQSDGYWDGAAVIWGHGAAFSGYVALKEAAERYPAYKSKYKQQYDQRLLTAIDKFRNKRNDGPEAYAVYPGESDERFYDDNIWVGLDMVDLYELTKEQKYLDRAKLVWEFVKSGTDNSLGGGVYWKEGTPGKNTCSTAPAAVLAAKLYQATKEKSYLDSAKELYQWLKNTLQDHSDYLYWDNVRLNDPNDPESGLKIDKTKYTYNAGQPMQAAVLLYKLTGESSYLEEAKNIAASAYKKWFIPFKSEILGESFQILEPGHVWFQAILLRGYVELFQVDAVDTYVSAYKKTLQHAWASSARNKNTNLLNTDFRGGTTQGKWEILYEGACVEMMARLAKLED